MSGDNVYFNLNDARWTADQVCTLDATDYVISSYDVMIKEGNYVSSHLIKKKEVFLLFSFG